MRVTTHAQQALAGAVVALLAACIVFTASTAEAAINKQLYFQGILKDSNGTAVADGAYDMVFSIYTNATGTTPLWTGTHTTANGNEVNVKSGVFGILLGSGAGNALNLDFNTDELYLGITVESDSEMTPRQRIGAAPYAFNADTVDGIGFATSTLSTGDMLYFNGTDLERLGIGTNDQILTLVGGLPAWANKGAQLFATTSDSSALHPADTSQTLIIGGSATTTHSMFEVYGNTLLSGDVAVSENASISGTLTLGGALDIGSEQFTDLTGSGLTLISGALTVATSTFSLDPSVINLAEGNVLVGDGSGNASQTNSLFGAKELLGC